MELIDKAAVVAEIENRIKETESMQPKFDQFWAGQISAFKGILKILDTLEMKDVDLEKEFDTYCENLYAIDIQEAPFTEMYDCAKYFFELGMKAKKGE